MKKFFIKGLILVAALSLVFSYLPVNKAEAAEYYVDTVIKRMEAREKAARQTGKPVNMTEQLLDGWFISKYHEFVDRKLNAQLNRLVNWYRDNNRNNDYRNIERMVGLTLKQKGNVNNTKVDLNTAEKENIYNAPDNTYTNEGPTPITRLTASYQKKYTQTKSTTLTNGMNATFGYKFTSTVGVPGTGSTGHELSFTLGYNMNKSETNTVTEERTYTVPSQTITVAPYKKVRVIESLDLYSQGGKQFMKGDFEVKFNDHEIVDKLYKPGYRQTDFNTISYGINKLDKANRVPVPRTFKDFIGGNKIVDASNMNLNLEGEFNIKGTAVVHNITTQELDLNGKPTGKINTVSKKIEK
ncbi:ETX/MTX2 family pore-forming toxin [Listeria sp. PSOL-1]|uniref:ETX/MTX2 family pore-forming toxin n=1 Tax=Listeria sp. PSOL-1 TaxID=1844999 RepID=UPI0013D602D5|nr:ETX/MTX2 family pore-forming toxin [Listeria sp. PSOL-1]